MVVRTKLFSEEEKAEAVRKYKDDWTSNDDADLVVHKRTGLNIAYVILEKNQEKQEAYYEISYRYLDGVRRLCGGRDFWSKLREITRQFAMLEQAGCFAKATEDERRLREEASEQKYLEQMRAAFAKSERLAAQKNREAMFNKEKEIHDAQERQDINRRAALVSVRRKGQEPLCRRG